MTPPRGRGRRQWDDLEAWQGAVKSILKKRRVEGLLEVTYVREVERRHVRKYGDRPARTEEQVRYVLQVRRNGEAIAAARRLLGWRLYATNAPAAAVLACQGRNSRWLKRYGPIGVRHALNGTFNGSKGVLWAFGRCTCSGKIMPEGWYACCRWACGC